MRLCIIVTLFFIGFGCSSQPSNVAKAPVSTITFTSADDNKVYTYTNVYEYGLPSSQGSHFFSFYQSNGDDLVLSIPTNELYTGNTFNAFRNYNYNHTTEGYFSLDKNGVAFYTDQSYGFNMTVVSVASKEVKCTFSGTITEYGPDTMSIINGTMTVKWK